MKRFEIQPVDQLHRPLKGGLIMRMNLIYLARTSQFFMDNVKFFKHHLLYFFLQMPHESTVEHTGELFEPTESSAFAPRGFSFSDDAPGTHCRSSSMGSNSSASVLTRTPHRCDDDDDDVSQEAENGEVPMQNPLVTVSEEKTSV